MATVNFSTYDRLNKPTSLQINALDAVTNPQIQAVVDALDNIILGVATRAVKSIPTVVDIGAAGPAASKNADRERKWLFRSQDSVSGKVYTNEYGTADNEQLPTADTDFLDLTVGVGLALKTAWDVVYRSPADNAGVLLSVQQVSVTG